LFDKSEAFRLTEYGDVEWAGSKDDQKSTTRYTFSLGSGVISRLARNIQQLHYCLLKQSTTMDATHAVVWLCQILEEMNLQQFEPTLLKFDNQITIKFTKNLILHNQTKHVKVHCHYIKEQVQNKEIKLIHWKIKQQTFSQKQLAEKTLKILEKMLVVSE
jgi:hypothetical protein